jgi:hypothetical protein
MILCSCLKYIFIFFIYYSYFLFFIILLFIFLILFLFYLFVDFFILFLFYLLLFLFMYLFLFSLNRMEEIYVFNYLFNSHARYVGRRSNTLLKVKTFEDCEAKVVGHIPGKGKFAVCWDSRMVHIFF